MTGRTWSSSSTTSRVASPCRPGSVGGSAPSGSASRAAARGSQISTRVPSPGMLRMHKRAAGLGGETVHHGQPQAGSAAGLLGGEERLAARASTSGDMPLPVSCTASTT